VQLLKIQRNEILEALVAGGLDPADCKVESDSISDHPLIVRHLPSESWFYIYSEDGIEFYGQLDVADSTRFRYPEVKWSVLLEKIENWAYDVMVELDTPDMWEQLRRENVFLGDTRQANVGNTLFTSTERAEVVKQVREVREYVKETCSLSHEQLALMEARFEEAEAASRHMGRREWMTLFYGTLFTLILSGVLTPETVQHILALVFHGLGHFFGVEVTPQLPPVT
jgi:hypothetical protein